MSLEKLFESLDEKVFTPELKNSLQEQFNEAVETRSQVIADKRIDERLTELNEKSEKYVDFINEKAEEYIKLREQEILKSLDEYSTLVVEEFIKESKKALDESVSCAKSDALLESMNRAMELAGVKLSNIINESNVVNTQKFDKLVNKNDELVNENIKLKEENEKLLKTGLINELSQDLTILEAEKFERLAETIEFSKDNKYYEKLKALREDVHNVNSVKEPEKKSVNESNEEKKVPEWARFI